MAAVVLETAGMDPTVLIGGDLPAWGGNARLGASDVFLAEACEAYDSFLDLCPQIGLVTNIEADHLDYYGDLNNILRSFRQFLAQVTGTAILCGDDPNVRALAQELRAAGGSAPPIVTYGLQEDMTLRATDLRLDGLQPSYVAWWRGERLGSVRLRVPGLHNVANSLAAAAASLVLGVPFDAIVAGLDSFTGTGRRFERLGETPSGVLVVDDYAHHPTEVRATLAAARRAFPDRRLLAVFQPHLPSRTRDLAEPFAESFADADQVVLTDIYLARESPIEGVTGAGLAALTADRRGAAHVTYVADRDALPGRLAEMVRPGDLILTLGAGDIRQAGEALLARLCAPTEEGR
jgi:UDP-N-acetylmuramate--alanine ligase